MKQASMGYPESPPVPVLYINSSSDMNRIGQHQDVTGGTPLDLLHPETTKSRSRQGHVV